MKTLLIVCATGIVMSTIVHKEIRDLLDESEIKANILQCKVSEIPKNMEDISLIVSAIQLKETYPVPIINAVPLLVGKGKQETQGEIIEYMK